MEVVYNLRTDGVQAVVYPPELHHDVKEAAGQWEAFCALPEPIKECFSATDDQWTNGYEVFSSSQSDDKKENFDFSVRDADVMLELARRTGDPTAQRFVEAAARLGEALSPMIHEFGTTIEGYGVDGFTALAERSGKNAFFRFLHYPSGGHSGATIAEPHVDHSGFTFHLYETTPGCERLDFDGEWKSLPVVEGQAIVFPSMQTQLVTRGEVKGLCHRVLANDTSVQVGRFAVVCFIGLEGVPSYDKKRHGRLPEKTPGFNYAMTPAAFSQLFKRVE